MKSRTLVATVLLSLAAGTLSAGEVSQGSLAKMGLAGVKPMTDREGSQVRGTGSFAAVAGFAFAFGGAPQSYFQIHATTASGGVPSSGFFTSASGSSSVTVGH